MTLIDQCASRTSGIGAAYQQLLSSVAHGQLRGLSRFLMRAPAPAEPGKVIVQMNLSDRDAALHLLAGPLCASTLVEHLRWFFGWDSDAVDPGRRGDAAHVGTHRRDTVHRSRDMGSGRS